MKILLSKRLTAVILLFIMLTGIAIAYLQFAAKRTGDRIAMAYVATGAPVAPFKLANNREILFLDSKPGPHYGHLAKTSLDHPNAQRELSDFVCNRVYMAVNRILCLRATNEIIPRFEAVILDKDLRELRKIPVAGMPSRSRISSTGRIASWTVFVHGDSYLSVGFSTRTTILNLETGELFNSIESFSITKDGKDYQSADVNFWGVTVANDDTTFYATLSTNGQTYLVKGDLDDRSVSTLKQNVECPSLSPDGTRIAFKKRIMNEKGGQPWRLHVLELDTLREKPLAENNSVDDQAIWLNNEMIAYSLPRPGTSIYDVWNVPSNGTGQPAVLMEYATSPAPITLEPPTTDSSFFTIPRSLKLHF